MHFPKRMSRPVLIFYMYCQKSFVEINNSQFIYHLFIHVLWVVRFNVLHELQKRVLCISHFLLQMYSVIFSVNKIIY